MKTNRKGIRCDRTCGRGCTAAEYRDALRTARRLAARLGPGWRARVGHNLGYHPGATNRRLGLYVFPGHGYHALLGPEAASCCAGTWGASARTPEAAVRKVVAKARAVLRAHAWLAAAHGITNLP